MGEFALVKSFDVTVNDHRGRLVEASYLVVSDRMIR
jgi:hypothetical protein